MSSYAIKPRISLVVNPDNVPVPYLACLIDTHGFLRLEPSPRYTIHSQREDRLRFFADAFGGNIRRVHKAQEWELSHNALHTALTLVYPFLILRKALAKDILDLPPQPVGRPRKIRLVKC